MTNLRAALDRYLSMRKGFGYKYEHQTHRLANFVAFMECVSACKTDPLRGVLGVQN